MYINLYNAETASQSISILMRIQWCDRNEVQIENKWKKIELNLSVSIISLARTFSSKASKLT